MTAYHLAELNIAQMRAPLTDPIMADFVNNLPVINATAEGAPGFVWRLQTPAGDATSIRIYDNDYLIVNMSVWESVDALFDFTYKSQHVDFFRRRREWFDKVDVPIVVMWWIEAGTPPTVQEAVERLDMLRKIGPSPLAFTFKQRYSVENLPALTAMKLPSEF